MAKQESCSQRSAIYLRNFEDGHAAIETTEGRSKIQLQFLQKTKSGLTLVELSTDEAYSVGSYLVEHARECGYDPVMGQTSRAD